MLTEDGTTTDKRAPISTESSQSLTKALLAHYKTKSKMEADRDAIEAAILSSRPDGERTQPRGSHNSCDRHAPTSLPSQPSLQHSDEEDNKKKVQARYLKLVKDCFA